MKNAMTVQELYNLYRRLIHLVEEIEEYDKNIDTYDVHEPGVLDLYEKMLEGEVTRKDFLIFAIKDILPYVEENYFQAFISPAVQKFKRYYCK